MLDSLIKIFLVLLLLSPLIWLIANDKKRTAQRRAAEELAREKMPLQHCMTCGNEFKPTPGTLRGSTLVEVVLWLFTFGVIGILYSIWRRLGVGKAKLACPACSSNSVVPANAPAARMHRKQLSAELGSDFQDTKPL